MKPKSPQLNFGNNITNGLIECIPFFEGRGTNVKDILTRLSNAISLTSWVNSPFGSAISFPGGAGTDNINLGTRTPTTNRSYEFYSYINATDATARRAWNWANIDLLLNSNVAGLNFQVNFSTTVGQWTFSTPTLNTWHHFVITYNGSSTGNVPTVFIDGLPIAVTTSVPPSGTILLTPGASVVGNNSSSGGNRCWNGNILYRNQWSRVLTQKEARMLYTNPWQIYTQLLRLPMTNAPAAVAGASTAGWKTLTGIGL